METRSSCNRYSVGIPFPYVLLPPAVRLGVGRGQWLAAREAGMFTSSSGPPRGALSRVASSRPTMTTLFALAYRRASSSAMPEPVGVENSDSRQFRPDD